MPLRRPPRTLLGILAPIAAVTTLLLAMLLWLGWKVVEQDRLLARQQAQERVERAADLVVAALQRSVSVSEQQLAAGARDWPSGAVSVTFRAGLVEVHPPGGLAWRPVTPPLPEAAGAVFADAEALEFQKEDRAAAARQYAELARSHSSAVRAGALLRRGRTLAATGRLDEALDAFARLKAIDAAAVEGVPAALLGSYARCELFERLQRTAPLIAEARQFHAHLQSAKWPLTEAVYKLCAKDAARWANVSSTSPTQPEMFAEMAGVLWEARNSLTGSGRRILAVADTEITAIWQNNGGTIRLLIAAPEYVESHWVRPAAAVAGQHRILFRLGDGGVQAPGPRTKRRATETGLPWTIATAGLDPPEQGAAFVLRRRLLFTGFALLVLMALSAGYLIVRAVNRELAVARLQSEFVAAVSHEFRTPLTALRQFTTRLREHHDLNEEDRRACYDVQSRATDRLIVLVETLLDFGRIEAGARRYRFEPQDCTELVRRVVDEFRGEPLAAGRRIEFQGNGSIEVETDTEALSRAVRNLLENAVKYSPDQRLVEVGLSRREATVRIAVRDQGIGIPARERAVIFSKFQRGEEARLRGIQGTGIGLTMVDEIVKAHHGHVEVDSEPGKGSTFTIVLPARG